MADGILGGLIGGGLDALGSIGSSIIGASSARQQEQWQEYMSDTAYQRAMSSMKAAGLNPILAAGGSGASTPSGTSFTPDNPFKGAASSGMALSMIGPQHDKAVADAETAKYQANAEASKAAIADNDRINSDFDADVTNYLRGVRQTRTGSIYTPSTSYLPEIAELKVKKLRADLNNTLQNTGLMVNNAAAVGYDNVERASNAAFYNASPNYLNIKRGLNLIGAGLGVGKDIAGWLPKP